MLGRLFRLIWGDDVERALRPLLIVGFVGSLGGSACWTFVGIWAIDELQASSSQLGLYFGLAAAVISASMGYLGGHLSDHLGRRPVILAGWGLTAFVPLSWTLVDDYETAVPLLLLCRCSVHHAMAATQALVADVVPPSGTSALLCVAAGGEQPLASLSARHRRRFLPPYRQLRRALDRCHGHRCPRALPRLAAVTRAWRVRARRAAGARVVWRHP